MARRINDEERIHGYFTSAEYERAEVLYNVVRGIMKQRAPATPRTRRGARRAALVVSNVGISDDK